MSKGTTDNIGLVNFRKGNVGIGTMNLNKVIIIGRMAADPESRTTASGQNVASIRVATNRVWTNQAGQKQEQVEFHSVTLWARLAQIATQYLKKGGLVMIEGRLQTRSWVGQDSQKRYRTEIVAENLQLGPRSAGGSFQSQGSSQKFTSQNSYPPQNFNKPPVIAKEIEEEEIPVINENEPITEPIISSNEIEEAEIELKDIPF